MSVYNPDERSNDIEMTTFDENIIEEFDDMIYYDKSKIECICPKCGKKHVMNFRWVGRGTPRKFCPSCKG
jgi:hypothetical protein